jgi:hypothetical protein
LNHRVSVQKKQHPASFSEKVYILTPNLQVFTPQVSIKDSITGVKKIFNGSLEFQIIGQSSTDTSFETSGDKGIWEKYYDWDHESTSLVEVASSPISNIK